jgi:hypothetical protein
MKLMNLLLAMAFAFSAAAHFDQAPPNFTYRSEKAVFVDFEDATYEITYDVSNKKVKAESTINFLVAQEGYPIFDLVENPSEVLLDGQIVTTEPISDPDSATTMRIIKQKVGSGTHQIKIKNEIHENVAYSLKGTVASAFWMSDLNDRMYLEQYLPANLEFDQYKMKFLVTILDNKAEYILKVNGKITELAKNKFEVICPSFYTTSSVFFHLFSKESFPKNAQFYYSSIDGRQIPVDIYVSGNDLQNFVSSTKTILSELETTYGPFPHAQIIIRGTVGGGGMEYAGATSTSLWALAHELFHSYHARSLMPANGNAGWMDEAIASWRDNKYPLRSRVSFSSTDMAGHSLWTRLTDDDAYNQGADFLSWIAYRMNQKGVSFKTFLKDYFDKYKFTTVTTELFQKELTAAAGFDLSKDFERYIYGRQSFEKSQETVKINPYHPRMSKKELLELTLR